MKIIDRLPLIDEVVREMRVALESGRYKAGGKFATERELVEELGVGRSTVREALRVMQARGYLEIKRGRGAFVRRTSEESSDKIRDWFAEHQLQLLDFMEVRSTMEPLAVRLCVERATDDELKEIGGVLQEFGRALKANNVVGLATSDEAFHLAIAGASHNPLVLMVERIVAEAFREYRMRAFAVQGNAENALEPHDSIYEALRSRDADGAVEAMLRHLEISRADIHAVVGSTKTNLTSVLRGQ